MLVPDDFDASRLEVGVAPLVKKALKAVLNTVVRNTSSEESSTHFSPEVLGISDQILNQYHSIPMALDGAETEKPKYVAKREDKMLPKSWRILTWDAETQDYVQNIDSFNPDGTRMYSTYEMFERMNALENKLIAQKNMDMPDVLPEEHFANGYAVYGPARKSKIVEIGGAEARAAENQKNGGDVHENVVSVVCFLHLFDTFDWQRRSIQSFPCKFFRRRESHL